MPTLTSSTLNFAVLAGILLVTPAFAVVSIDYVTIGNAGNAADPADGDKDAVGVQNFGAVAYVYQIARNETTISQYAEFLNAVARTDTYSLYSTSMTTGFINGISRSGASGSYNYTVNPGSANKPITYVSWFDAARFCNWLHHGQPVGLQTTGTTENGAYTLLGAVTGTGFVKNVAAKVWIPSENEWYKAAHYDPNKGGVGGYWPLATQSDTLAGNTIGVAGSANYFDGDYVGFPGPALTDVGAYGANSESAYGTNDQTGNVFEWNDGVIGSSRRMRGGSWLNNEPNLTSSIRTERESQIEDNWLGFRVASVPEPTSSVLTILAGGVMLLRRKR